MPQDLDASLRCAIYNRQVDRVRTLLGEGADLNAVDDKGTTPLMLAATVGSPEIVRVLLDAGANVTQKDNLGYTAQDLAYWYGEQRMGAYTSESVRIAEMLKQRRVTRREPA